MMNRCAILGSSGLVSQTIQYLLENHPWFELVQVAGSEEKVGMHTSDFDWRLPFERPRNDLKISSLDDVKDVEIVFSALPSDVAAIWEKKLAKNGMNVFSNASSFRRVTGVPMLIPEMDNSGFKGYQNHACATNCTVIPVAIPLYAISQHASISSVSVRTEQSLSGAGWRLMEEVNQLNRLSDDSIPGEAEKIVAELQHLLGNSQLHVDVHCQRVVEDFGHIVHVEFQVDAPTSVEQLKTYLELEGLDLPSSPKHVIQLVDRPPNRESDLWFGGFGKKSGMGITVGDLKNVGERTFSFSALSHNTVRGAAGGVILLAEYAHSLGFIYKS